MGTDDGFQPGGDRGNRNPKMANAPYFPESFIARIKDGVNIVQIISEVVSLKKAGRNYQGLCPFHAEKTPSFMVSEEKQIFHCFGCGLGGNVFTFLMHYQHLSFPEAVVELAGRLRIPLPEVGIQEKTDTQKMKERLFFPRPPSIITGC